jgi:hypothetical protein
LFCNKSEFLCITTTGKLILRWRLSEIRFVGEIEWAGETKLGSNWRYLGELICATAVYNGIGGADSDPEKEVDRDRYGSYIERL